MSDLTHSKRQILVLEDDLALQAVLERVIEGVSPGARVTWVTSAEEALGLLRLKASEADRPFDLIIADIFLEGRVTGIEFWNTCYSLIPEVSVVITSSVSVDSFFNSIGHDVVAPPFLEKPFRVGACRQLLESLLGSEEEGGR